MLSSWKCSKCETYNSDSIDKCTDCNQAQDVLSPISKIMHQQQLLFDGYMRMQILSYLSNNASKLMTDDVLTVGNKFYTLHIMALMNKCKHNLQSEDDHLGWLDAEERKNDADLYILRNLCSELFENNEWFITYKVLKMLLEYYESDKDDTFWEPYTNNYLGSVLFDWNQETINDKDIADETKHHYEKAIELKPDAVGYRLSYGEFLEDWTEFELAKIQFLKAIELKPDHPESLVRCGYCCQALGNTDTARKYFQEAIDIDPKDAKYYIEFASFLELEIKDFVEAKKYLEKAIELEAENVKAYKRLAVVYRDGIQDFQESERYYLKCLEMDGNNSGLYYSYGYLLYLMGEFQRAKDQIDTSWKLCDGFKNHWMYFYLGLVNQVMGNQEIATESLSKAVDVLKSRMYYRDASMVLPFFKEKDNYNKEFYDRYIN